MNAWKSFSDDREEDGDEEGSIGRRPTFDNAGDVHGLIDDTGVLRMLWELIAEEQS